MKTWISSKLLDIKNDRLAKKMFGKSFMNLSDKEFREFQRAKYGASSDFTPIQIEYGGSYEPPEDKPLNPVLSSFCKLIYRPLSIVVFIVWIFLAIMALLYAYELWKAVSASGVSALFSMPLLRVVGCVAGIVILKIITDFIFRIGWHDDLKH